MTQDTQTIQCSHCGDTFTGEPWKKLCFPCWRESQKGQVHIYKAETPKAEPQFHRELAVARAELSTAQKDVRRLTLQLDRVSAQLAMAQVEVARSRRGQTRTTVASVSKEMLRFLRQRCHPDKCTDTPMANEVMQWLNRL